MSNKFSNLLGGALAGMQVDDSLVYDRIIINEDFKALIPPLASVELAQLEENILKEGVRDPIILWPNEDSFILIDGHNRYSVCQKHGLPFPFKKVSFANEDEVKDWMIRNQLGRRNLSPEQQSYLRGLRYLQEKSQGKRSDLTSGQIVQKLNPETTAESLAKEYNVSAKTIIRDGDYAQGIEVISKKDPEQKKKILKGESQIKKAKVQSLAKHPERIEEILNREPEKKILVKVKLSSEEVARIAFAYIMEETRVPKKFYYDLGKDYDNIKPLEFFQDWDENRKASDHKDIQ